MYKYDLVMFLADCVISSVLWPVLPGSRGRDLARSTSRELTNGGRVGDLLLARLPEGLYQQHCGGGQRQNKYQKHSSGVAAGGETWRSTSRLGASSNRSMPRLNAGGSGMGASGHWAWRESDLFK